MPIMRRFNYYSKDIKQMFEQKYHLLQNWGACVDTIFWKKQGQEGIRKNIRWKEYNRPIEGRTERSTRSADGQKSSALTVGQQVRAIGRCKTRGSDDRHEEGGIQRNAPDGEYGRGGLIHD
jgi:hypothetical protein